MKRIAVIVRWSLTAALMLGVYSETGVWTTLALALLVIANEVKIAILQSELDEWGHP